jgi:hypothetical protein
MIRRSVLMLHLPALLLLAACATGSAIVTGTTRTPVPREQVRVYLEPPAAFETIGLVTAASDAGLTEQGSLDYAIEELKRQAAKLGANGVLLVSSGDRTSTIVGGQGTRFAYTTTVSAKTVQGRAIYVTAQ